jgi:hypothetical protein
LAFALRAVGAQVGRTSRRARALRAQTAVALNTRTGPATARTGWRADLHSCVSRRGRLLHRSVTAGAGRMVVAASCATSSKASRGPRCRTRSLLRRAPVVAVTIAIADRAARDLPMTKWWRSRDSVVTPSSRSLSASA